MIGSHRFLCAAYIGDGRCHSLKPPAVVTVAAIGKKAACALEHGIGAGEIV